MAEAEQATAIRSGHDSAGPLLELAGVEKHFGGIAAVHDVTLEIDAGTFVAIMGPSGCGKTTTLRLLAGLERPTGGSIYFRGKEISGLDSWQRGMPLVWQNLALFPFLDVQENVAFGLKMAGVGRAERRKRARAWLDHLGIGDFADRDISVLSGGQLQRVALARALVTEPRILLLDEPLSALDAHLVARMQTELTRLQRELEITFVYVTHSQSEAFAMADQVVIMNDGRVQQVGSAREVYRSPANHFVADFVGTNNILPGTVESADGTDLVVRTSLGPMRTIASGNSAFSVSEEVYLVVSADRIGFGHVEQSDDGNLLSGKLLTEQFTGAVVTAYVDVGSGQELLVQLQQRDWELLDARSGQELTLRWMPEDCFVVRG